MTAGGVMDRAVMDGVVATPGMFEEQIRELLGVPRNFGLVLNPVVPAHT